MKISGTNHQRQRTNQQISDVSETKGRKLNTASARQTECSACNNLMQQI